MSDKTAPEKTAKDPMEEIRDALTGGEVSLHLIRPLALRVGGKPLGVGVQVKVRNRKVGPVIFPAEGETVSNVLSWLGDMAV